MDEEGMPGRAFSDWVDVGGLRASDRRRLVFGNQVELICEATAGDERFVSRLVVEAYVYDDLVMREQVEDRVREQLLREIMEKWKPEIRVRR